jgi:geranylgeranylglycerol-phosphate geranylgeranyltransferase
MNNMDKIHGFLRLGRPFTSILGSLATVSASVAGVGVRALCLGQPIIIAAILVFVFIMGANSLNDYVDRFNDKINHPERPLPSGLIAPNSVLFFSAILLSASGILAAFLSVFVGIGSFLLFIAALIIQITYEYWFKRIKFVGNYLIGLMTVLAFVLGGVVVKAILASAIIASTAFLAILAREIVKDVEDLRGDANRMSLPKVIGTKRANLLASIILLLAISISLAAFYPLLLFGPSYLVLILPTDSLFLVCIPLIFENSKKARRILKLAMLCALLSFVVGGIFA